MAGVTLFGGDGSHFDGILLQDLGRYEKCLTDASQGPAILAERELQLGLTIQQESQALENLRALVTGCAKIGRRLQERFQRRLAQLEGNDGDDSRATVDSLSRMRVDSDEDSVEGSEGEEHSDAVDDTMG